jgi:hypothetical protein
MSDEIDLIQTKVSEEHRKSNICVPINFGKAPVLEGTETHALQVRETQALETLAQATNALATFITGGGLTELLSGYARTQAVQAILGGLASHDGRNSLDARTMGQNALEIVTQIEKVFDKYHEKKNTTEERDPHIHDEDDRAREGETRAQYGERMRLKKEAEGR